MSKATMLVMYLSTALFVVQVYFACILVPNGTHYADGTAPLLGAAILMVALWDAEAKAKIVGIIWLVIGIGVATYLRMSGPEGATRKGRWLQRSAPRTVNANPWSAVSWVQGEAITAAGSGCDCWSRLSVAVI